MGFVSEAYCKQLATQHETVVLAMAIHAAWAQLTSLHSVDDERETNWDKLSTYLKYKFLLAADSATNTMQWDKIYPIVEGEFP